MSAPPLSESLVQAGRRLLQALDEAGLGAQGAGWIYDHALLEWRFVVATSLVETMGRSKVYKNLLAVMGKLDMPEELTIDDIHLITTTGAFYMGLAGMFRVRGLITFTNCKINDKKFDAVLYRWGAEAPTEVEKKKVEKDFRRRTKELTG